MWEKPRKTLDFVIWNHDPRTSRDGQKEDPRSTPDLADLDVRIHQISRGYTWALGLFHDLKS